MMYCLTYLDKSIGLFFMLIFVSGLNGQLSEVLEVEERKLNVKSGKIEYTGTDTTLVHIESIETDFNRFLQLHFSSYNLEGGAFLKIYSADKPEWFQLHNEKTIQSYKGYTAAFSSEKLIVEVYGVKANANIFFEIDYRISRKGPGMTEKSICGNDNRVLSTDVRVARMFAGGGCTAWLMSNGTVLTAGHCVSNFSGVFNLGPNNIIEFNVPVSTAGGNTVPSAPQDQYVIDETNVSFENPGDGTNACQPGQDWAIMEVIPNSTTGLVPAMAQGDFFRPTLATPGSASNIRITGHGNDSNGPPQNWRAQQTHSDNFVSRTNNGSGGIFDNYQTDTEGANSGSPVIRSTNTDFTYGIHTCGGCNAASTGSNVGTAFDYNPLQFEMSDFWSTTTIHVDKISDYITETGSIFLPFDTVEEAHNLATPTTFNNVIVVKGTYDEVDNLLLDNQMLLHAPVGNSLIK